MSRLKENDAAIDLLDGVIAKASIGTLQHLATDSDLDPIREDPRFVEMYQRARKRFEDETQ